MASQARGEKAPQDAVDAFREARFGMFVHYGLYSLLGRHEWAMGYERLPMEDYRPLAKKFNPRDLDVADWIKAARKAGMRYACLTTRHHDGFSLFATEANGFNSVETAAKRDFVREFVDACRKHDLRPCLYYSVADWGDPGYRAGPKGDSKAWKRFVETVHLQLKELMTNYGEITYLFYDGCPPPETWDAAAINAEMRRLQPQILISDRCGLEEDVKSAEQHTLGDVGKLWESCMTMNKSWGWNCGDPFWKTPEESAYTLLTCVHNGGNFLYNVGPHADGSIPKPSRKILRKLGPWVKANAEAIYGTLPNPFSYRDLKLSSYRGETAYVPLHYYHGPESVIAGVKNKVKKARLVCTGETIRFTQKPDRILLKGLPEKNPDTLIPIVALELDGAPEGIPHPFLGAGKYD